MLVGGILSVWGSAVGVPVGDGVFVGVVQTAVDLSRRPGEQGVTSREEAVRMAQVRPVPPPPSETH